jgi:hypothetical protein
MQTTDSSYCSSPLTTRSISVVVHSSSMLTSQDTVLAQHYTSNTFLDLSLDGIKTLGLVSLSLTYPTSLDNRVSCLFRVRGRQRGTCRHLMSGELYIQIRCTRRPHGAPMWDYNVVASSHGCVGDCVEEAVYLYRPHFLVLG